MKIKASVSKSLKQYKNMALIIATLALVVLSARVPALNFLAFICLVPFAFLLSKKTSKAAFYLSTICATLFWIGTSYWLIEANVSFAQSKFLVVIIVFLLFCLWQALPYVIMAVCYGYFKWWRSDLGPVLAAIVLTLAWVVLPSPLPWIPQNSLYVYPKFVALLDLSGMSLLLFVSTLACFSIEYIARPKAAYKKWYGMVLMVIPVLMLAYGQMRQVQLDAEKTNAAAGQWLTIGYIQPNLLNTEPMDRAYQVTEQLIKDNHPDLIVWPEIAAYYSFIENPKDRNNTLNLVYRYQQDLLVVSGYVYVAKPHYGEQASYYNQAQLIKDARVQGVYSKEVLVPFFEYMPSALSFLRRWMPDVLYYEAGKDQKLIHYKDKIKLAIAICYEVIFPEYVRQQIKEGANIIINPVDDLIFGEGAGSYYHFATAYFRTIENRVPWVRATNTGISVIVGRDGQPLTKASKINTIASDSAKVFIPDQTSLYSRWGDWFSFVLLAILFLIRMAKFKS